MGVLFLIMPINAVKEELHDSVEVMLVLVILIVVVVVVIIEVSVHIF